MTEERIIGRNAVAEALRTGADISKIYVYHSARGGSLNEIYTLAKRQGVPIARVDSKQFSDMTIGLQRSESAQGIVAIISKVKFQTLDTILQSASSKDYPLLLMLDRIQDPQNFGAILRSAAFFHADGVIISKENQAPVTETVIKASAGGAFHIMIARETNLHQVLVQLKEKGYWIATSSANSPLEITNVDFKIPLAVIVGNEGSGVKRILREKSDITFSVPRLGKIDSLNVSVATGIICYEIQRQRSRYGVIGAPESPSPSAGTADRSEIKGDPL